MFRELTRKSQRLSEEECVEILTNETRGVLSVTGDNGYPYGMPMNHFYNHDDGCIWFHCGMNGHRTDSLKRDDRVSFCVCDKGRREEGGWAFRVKSVIVFGMAQLICDADTVVDITTRLSRKFTSDEEYIRKELNSAADRTLLIRLVPEQVCGKIVTEA